MAPRFCSRCGQPVPATGGFCPACGAAIASPPAAGVGSPGAGLPPTYGYPSPPPPFAPPFAGAPVGYRPSPASAANDLSALSNVFLAAILGLIGTGLAVAELVASPVTSFLSVNVTSTSTSFQVNEGALYLLLAFGLASLVFGFLELFLYRQAFHTLSAQDPTFSTPSTLTLVAIISLVLILLIGVGLVAALLDAVACAGAGNAVTSACLSFGTLLTLVAILGIVAIVALVGYIGFLVGVWRLGTRYDNGLFKVGAVLLIFPFLNVVGTILILVAARDARARTQRGPTTYGF